MSEERISCSTKPSGNSDFSWFSIFVLAGVVLGAGCPIIYGRWIMTSGSCGTSAFGGLLIMTAGAALGALIAGLAGAFLGAIFRMIRFPNSRVRNATATIIVLLAVTFSVLLTKTTIHRESHRADTRAFLIFVSKSVEEFYEVNGRLPDSLSEIDPLDLENELDIDVSDIEFKKSGNGFEISYLPTGAFVLGDVTKRLPDAPK